MTEKKLERLLSEMSSVADRLSEDDSTLSDEEVTALLLEAGYPPDDLRKQMHENLKTLVRRLRKAGAREPAFIRDLIDRTATIEELVARNPGSALAEMRKRFRDLVSAAGAGTVASSERLALARAYRKSSELSTEDARLLDELEQKLKARAKGENTTDGRKDR